MTIPRAVLICHPDEPLNRFGLARWMASFLDLAAIIEIHEPPARVRRRVIRELRRVGFRRFLDVLAFRLYSWFVLRGKDREWEARLLRRIEARYAEVPLSTRILLTASPNSSEAEELLKDTKPHIIIARCKSILHARIFGQAGVGTFVMHPGICPEYRNAHGCFWALANRDLGRVGMTLLKIDQGVDTGPVYGYYSATFDEVNQTHNMIQSMVVFENLDALQAKFLEIMANTATTVDTAGRASRTWGQPWFSSYVRWKRAAGALKR